MAILGGQIGESMSQQREADIQNLRDFSLLNMFTPEMIESYRGKEIKFPNIGTGPSALGSLLNLLDPTGMIGGPSGFIYNTSSQTSPQLLKMLDTIKKVGATAEELSPRMSAVTAKMPVNVMKPIPKSPLTIAEYLEPSQMRPLGTAQLYRPDPTAVIHEGAHGLQSLDPEVNNLLNVLYAKSPIGTEAALTKVGVSPYILRQDFGARLIENLMAEHVGNKLGISLPQSKIPFTSEAKDRMWKLLQSEPAKSNYVPLKESTKLTKTKVPKTSEILQQTYTDMMNLTSEFHPLRSKIEENPFARVKFYNELKTRVKNLPESSYKKQATTLLSNIKDPKDPSAALDLEFVAQHVHEGLRALIPKQEMLLFAEFGSEDAPKIISKLWNNVLNPLEEGKVKLLKTASPGRKTIEKQKDIAKSKEIQDIIKEEIGKYIQKPGRGGTITSKKGGGMMSTESDKLSTYLEDIPRPTEVNQLGRKWEF